MNKVYDILIDKVCDLIEEKKMLPWQCPYQSVNPTNFITKKSYRGFNKLYLSFLRFESQYFVSFKQARQLGGSIKKGQNGFPVIYYNFIEKKKESGKVESIPFAKYSTVFNLDQCENIDTSKIESIKNETLEFDPVEAAENIINNYKTIPAIEYDKSFQSCYIPSKDVVRIQNKEYFSGVNEFYSTIFHELVHSTGSKKRLNRFLEGTSYSKAEYSKEGLIAEIGAFTLCREAQIETTLDNSTAYIQSWIKVLKNNTSWLFSAASKAEKATNYILNK